MGVYANQLRKRAETMKLERLQAIVGHEEFHRIMREEEKYREELKKKKTLQSRFGDPLSEAEVGMLADALRAENFAQMADALHVDKKLSGAARAQKAHYIFTEFSFRYLRRRVAL